MSRDTQATTESLHRELDSTNGDPIVRVLAHAVLLLVDELAETNRNLKKSAAAIDYISHHLNEVGERS